jgi:riboflavin synthase
MFTGIIESLGVVEKIIEENNIICIRTELDLGNCKIGSSICCDGVCLTAVSIQKINNFYLFEINAGEETKKKSTVNIWKIGTKINIEKSLRVGDEISGHFVYGHVDSIVKVDKIISLRDSWEFHFSFNNYNQDLDIKKFIVEKGSVAINGISLTVVGIFDNYFSISVIPHTYKNTNLSFLKMNDKVNIEFDPLARYMSNKYEK